MTPADHPGVLVWPPIVFGTAVAGALLLGWLRPLPFFTHPAAMWAGAALIFFGVALNVWGAVTMRKAGTNINPARPAVALVSTGPFNFSRNPLYVAGMLLLLGLSLVLNNFWGVLALALAWLILHYGVILREERYLSAKFGESYRQYCATVRRYF